MKNKTNTTRYRRNAEDESYDIATPMYGGMCHGLYTKSYGYYSSLMNHGIQSQIYYLFNESLITRARNYCVANFLKSDATHLMFIDSDIVGKLWI